MDFAAERRMNVARRFNAGSATTTRTGVASAAAERGFNRRYATGCFVNDPPPTLKGRAKLSRRPAAIQPSAMFGGNGAG
jgi:hypothetical protein